MYKQHKNGQFRMRASFSITPEQIQALNPICERLGMTVGRACQQALDDFILVENMKTDLVVGETVSACLIRLDDDEDSQTIQ